MIDIGYNLVIESANAQTILPVVINVNNYEIDNAKLADGSITSIKIANKTVTYDKIETTNANDGDILNFNGSTNKWEPETLNNILSGNGGAGGGQSAYESINLGSGMANAGSIVGSGGTIAIEVGSGFSSPSKILQFSATGNYTIQTDNTVNPDSFFRLANVNSPTGNYTGDGSGFLSFYLGWDTEGNIDGVVDTDEVYEIRLRNDEEGFFIREYDNVTPGASKKHFEIARGSGTVEFAAGVSTNKGLILGSGANAYTFPSGNGEGPGLYLVNNQTGTLKWSDVGEGTVSAISSSSHINVTQIGTVLTLSLNLGAIPALDGIGNIDIHTLSDGSLDIDRFSSGDVITAEYNTLNNIDTGTSIETRLDILEANVFDLSKNDQELFLSGDGKAVSVTSDSIDNSNLASDEG